LSVSGLKWLFYLRLLLCLITLVLRFLSFGSLGTESVPSEASSRQASNQRLSLLLSNPIDSLLGLEPHLHVETADAWVMIASSDYFRIKNSCLNWPRKRLNF